MNNVVMLTIAGLVSAAIVSAASAQTYKVGDKLPGGQVVTGLGVGPKGNAVYQTKQGMILQSQVASPKVTPAAMPKPKVPAWNNVMNNPKLGAHK